MYNNHHNTLHLPLERKERNWKLSFAYKQDLDTGAAFTWDSGFVWLYFVIYRKIASVVITNSSMAAINEVVLSNY
jgi:hypothetical protein